MPHIAITMFPGRTPEQKQALANKVQKLFEEELGLDKKVISVSVEDVARDKWPDHIKQFPDEIMYVKPGV
jgi:4-oxalocrotonate tautomerase